MALDGDEWMAAMRDREMHDLSAAEVIIGELLARTIGYAAGPLPLRIDWNDPRPVVTVEGMPPGSEQLAMPEGAAGEGDRGPHMVKTLAQHIAFESHAEDATRLTGTIPIARRVG
ncbi:MAG TPA: hypothetical protein VNF68_07170 [Candidatus Baltobacteraceae bacterium]|nr:hypothetical protein [Candidatus Baltobacteraceae bacterium]